VIGLSDCSTCKQKGVSCHEVCPVCGKKGLIVSSETVNAMLKDNVVDPSLVFQLCTNPICHVSYFSCEELFFDLDEIKVPIWFKKEKSRYLVCYCRNIELVHIIQAVKELNGEQDINIILKYLQKDQNTKLDCLHLNPTGISCEKLLSNAIDYAHKLYIQQSR
jgi:hypothetical protein